jgi:hypothetical protein
MVIIIYNYTAVQTDTYGYRLSGSYFVYNQKTSVSTGSLSLTNVKGNA